MNLDCRKYAAFKIFLPFNTWNFISELFSTFYAIKKITEHCYYTLKLV